MTKESASVDKSRKSKYILKGSGIPFSWPCQEKWQFLSTSLGILLFFTAGAQWIIEKAKEYQWEVSICLMDYRKPSVVSLMSSCGMCLEEWKSWEILSSWKNWTEHVETAWGLAKEWSRLYTFPLSFQPIGWLSIKRKLN